MISCLLILLSHTSSSSTDIPHHSSARITTDEVTLMHPFHQKPTVHTAIRSCCYAFYALGQVYNKMYPPLWKIQSGFTALSILCALPVHLSSILLNSRKPVITSTVFIVTYFPEYHIIEIIQYVAFLECLLEKLESFKFLPCLFLAHLLLTLNDTSLFRCTIYLSTYSLKDILATSNLWQL